MGVRRTGRGGLPLLRILKFSAKKVVYLVLTGKKQISLLLAPLEKFLPTPMDKTMFRAET